MIAPEKSQVSLKTVFTVCFGIAVIAAFGAFVIMTRVTLTLTLVSMLLAVALSHGSNALQRHGMRKKPATAVMICALLALLAGAGLLIIPPGISQAKALLAQLPSLTRQMQHSRLIELVRSGLGGATGDSGPKGVTTQLENAAKPVAMFAVGALSVVTDMVTILVVTIFMLIFGGALTQRLLSEATPDRRDLYDRVLDKIYSSVGGYILGLLSIVATNCALTTLFLAITRMPFFLPLGILSGLSSFVPYAGPVVAGSAISILAFATGGLWKGVATAIYFILYGQFEGNLMAPLVYRRTANVNPLLTLLSVLFFAELGGVGGAVLAVPLMAASQIIVFELLAIRRTQLNMEPIDMESDSQSDGAAHDSAAH